jgi:3-oxoacyl-(acyl-carrier-protein) synthase
LDEQRVVITGMGAVSALGRGVPALWDGLVAGRSGLRPITVFDASPFRNDAGGEVPGYAGGPRDPRALQFLMDALDEALADAAPGDGVNSDRLDVVLGTNFGGMSAIEPAMDPDGDLGEEGITRYCFQSAVDRVAERSEAHGRRSVLSLACASGAAVMGMGADAIRRGDADMVIAGCYDELSLFSYAGLSALRAITPDRIRPFDKNRKGTQFGEGAAVLVLESLAHARKRGARPHAELLGHALNNDAYHMTAPEKEGRGIRALMNAALGNAGVAPDHVGHINCHATGTPYNDVIETGAIKAVFGAHAAALKVTANKSMIGHAMGAAGGLEAIATIRTLQTGIVPPTMGIEEQDPECDLDCSPGSAGQTDAQIAISNSFGLGGTNASVVLKQVSA